MKISNFFIFFYFLVLKFWVYCVNDCIVWLCKLFVEEKFDEKKFLFLIVFFLLMVVYFYFVCVVGLIMI